MSVVQMRGMKEAPKAVRSHMETLLLTPEIVGKWLLPPFQRQLRVNCKVLEIAEALKENGGFIEGVLSLGVIKGDNTLYLFDGQHRIEAAKLSGVPEFIADVRIVGFDTMAEMGQEFVKLNSSIVRLRPDDVLRGMEGSTASLRTIRKHCEFVGYDQIRRNTASPTLSMAATLRCWRGSGNETPSLTGGGTSADVTARLLSSDDTAVLCRFLLLARTAWGADLENARLWGNLNMMLCMWLYRQTVINPIDASRRITRLNDATFKKCLMQVSAWEDYVGWLVGRNANERDRSPCYGRLKNAFVHRLKEEGLSKPVLPAPAWASK